MCLGSDCVGGEVTGYLQIVECGAKSESGKKQGGGEGEGERRERVSSLSLPTYPTPRCFSCSHLFAPCHNLNAWNRLTLFKYLGDL